MSINNSFSDDILTLDEDESFVENEMTDKNNVEVRRRIEAMMEEKRLLQELEEFLD